MSNVVWNPDLGWHDGAECSIRLDEHGRINADVYEHEPREMWEIETAGLLRQWHTEAQTDLGSNEART